MARLEDMGFDLEGRPLGYSPMEVRKMIVKALDDPESNLVAVILRRGDELMIQLMGPPSKDTLDDLEQVLTTAITGYRRILKGQ